MKGHVMNRAIIQKLAVTVSAAGLAFGVVACESEGGENVDLAPEEPVLDPDDDSMGGDGGGDVMGGEGSGNEG